MAERELKVKISAEVKDLEKGLDSSKNKVKDFDNTVKKSGSSVKKSAADMSQSSAKSLGSLEQGIGKVSPAAGKAVTGMKSMSLGARALNAALGPIGIAVGLLAGAIAALTSYFRGSVEGQQRMAKIMAVLNGATATLKDLFIDLGKWIVWAFENPQQAIKDLWAAIKQNFINRFEGMVKMIHSGWDVIRNGAMGVAKAVAGIFDRSKRGEAKAYFDAAGEGLKEFGKAAAQTVTGVEFEKLTGAAREFGKAVISNAREAGKLQERLNQLWQDELDAKVKIARLDGEIAEARRIANDDAEDLNKQIQAQEKAMELVAQKYALQEQLAAEALAIQREQMALSENTKEDMEKEAELHENLIRLQQQRENETRSLLRRMGTLRNMQEAEAEEVRKALEAEQKLRDEMLAKQQAARDDILERIRKEGMTELEILQEKMDKELAMFEGNEAEKAKVHEYWANKKADLERELAEEKAEREAEMAEAQITLFGEMGQTMEQSAQGIGVAFADSAKAGKEATKNMIKQFEAQIISALIAKIMASPIPFPANVAVAAGAGAMVSGLMGQIPAFADGAKVTSPTLAMFGEYPGARTNPEYALREDQLRSIAGGGGGQLTARVSGQDLLFALNEAKRRNNASF